MFKTKYIYVYLILGGLGLFGGWFYWYNWGCTDYCPINSSWKLMMLKGGLFGVLGAALFHPKKPKSTDENA